ncbi:hypothetical protein CF326_g8932 [Tilletia indica]|nr:hypothetical protein CF326_g8932 [Tilletia indica]
MPAAHNLIQAYGLDKQMDAHSETRNNNLNEFSPSRTNGYVNFLHIITLKDSHYTRRRLGQTSGRRLRKLSISGRALDLLLHQRQETLLASIQPALLPLTPAIPASRLVLACDGAAHQVATGNADIHRILMSSPYLSCVQAGEHASTS